MAQIWLTYHEFSDLVVCANEDARDRVAQLGLDRRRSHDGLTRVNLSDRLADAFTAAFAARLSVAPSPVGTLQSLLSASYPGQWRDGAAPAEITRDDVERRYAA